MDGSNNEASIGAHWKTFLFNFHFFLGYPSDSHDANTTTERR